MHAIAAETRLIEIIQRHVKVKTTYRPIHFTLRFVAICWLPPDPITNLAVPMVRFYRSLVIFPHRQI